MSDTYPHWKPTTRPTTQRAYVYAWRRYTEWCAAEGLRPWDDPDGSTFAGFVVAMTRAGLQATTLRQCRAAIVYRYATDPALYGLADPTKADRARAEMAKITERNRQRRPAKALEMTPDVLEKVLDASAVRRSGEGHDAARLRHLEAEATLRLMYDAALRADDMARAEWADLDGRADDDGYRTLYVRPGKTRTDRHAPVSPATWAALQRWRAATPDPSGRISTAGNAQSIGARIRRLGEFAGVKITGHSPRRGRATAAARDGATEYELMALGGWKSPDVVSEYVKPLAANRVAAKLYPNGDHETEAQAEAGPEPDPYDPRRARLDAHTAALDMARELGATRDHPVVAEYRARFVEYWPFPDPPRDCARPGCPGFVFVPNPRPDERYCCEPCRAEVHNAKRRADRRK